MDDQQLMSSELATAGIKPTYTFLKHCSIYLDTVSVLKLQKLRGGESYYMETKPSLSINCHYKFELHTNVHTLIKTYKSKGSQQC